MLLKPPPEPLSFSCMSISGFCRKQFLVYTPLPSQFSIPFRYTESVRTSQIGDVKLSDNKKGT